MTRDRETAGYIADMILEMRNLAKGLGLKTLQGLLEISYYEAYSEANRVQISQEEIEHIMALEAQAKRRSLA